MIKDSNLVIGIVGGMGSYATVDLFKRILDAFPTEKDWEKPRILIDNYSTIPSRVRAVLYNERKDEVIECLASSIRNLMNAGNVQKIIVGCHTAHIFLPDAVKLVEGSENCVVNIIDAAVDQCVRKKFDSVRLLATEGTVQTGIYMDHLSRADINVVNPSEKELKNIRSIIEDVKQNKMSAGTAELFHKMVEKDKTPVLLGCSELPVIFRYCKESGLKFDNEVTDPFQIVIDELVQSASVSE